MDQIPAVLQPNSRKSLFQDNDDEDITEKLLNASKSNLNCDGNQEFLTPDIVSRSISTNSFRSSGRFNLTKTQNVEDPLSLLSQKPYSSTTPSATPPPNQSQQIVFRNESLTIQPNDETRIVNAMASAAKKKTSGSVFSVKVDISPSGTLGIGVKDLPGNLLAVSMLRRTSGELGAGEAAGLRLGDIVFGINFLPAREGSKTLLKVLKKENQKHKKSVYLQCWRCHQLCSESIPGALFPKADDVIVQAHFLYHTKVFSDWERWNFIEILSSNMLEDMKLRAALDSYQTAEKKAVGQKKLRSRQNQLLDLQRNILQAKGLRNALCVRVVHTKSLEDTVVYVLRVEDVETGLQWVVHRRYRDFYALNAELMDMTTRTKDVSFPKKRLSLRIRPDRLVEQRIVMLEYYVRKALHVLTQYATMEPAASRALRHIQNFLGVDKYIDCIHPPAIDDQRYIELMAYRFLNDYTSPACQQCVRFVTTVVLEDMVEVGSEEAYRPVLEHMKQALAEVEGFVLDHHEQQMVVALGDRNHLLNVDQCKTFVRRCVRRQVEAAIYLPLRRSIFKIMFPFIAVQGRDMQNALATLMDAPPKYFTVDPYVLKAKQLPAAIKAFRDVILAYLPADQGQLLMQAASAVMELYAECKNYHRAKEVKRESLINALTSPVAAEVPASQSPAPSMHQFSSPSSSSSSSSSPLYSVSPAGPSVSSPHKSTAANATDASNSVGPSLPLSPATPVATKPLHTMGTPRPASTSAVEGGEGGDGGSLRFAAGANCRPLTLTLDGRNAMNKSTLVVPRLASESNRMSSRRSNSDPDSTDDLLSKLYTHNEEENDEEEAGLFDSLQTTGGRNMSHIDGIGVDVSELERQEAAVLGNGAGESLAAEAAVAAVKAAATAAAQTPFESRRRGLTVFESMNSGGSGATAPDSDDDDSECFEAEARSIEGGDDLDPESSSKHSAHILEEVLTGLSLCPSPTGGDGDSGSGSGSAGGDGDSASASVSASGDGDSGSASSSGDARKEEDDIGSCKKSTGSPTPVLNGFGVDPTEVAVIQENHAQLAQGELQGELGARERLVRAGGSPSRQSGFVARNGDNDSGGDGEVVKKLSSRPPIFCLDSDEPADVNTGECTDAVGEGRRLPRRSINGAASGEIDTAAEGYVERPDEPKRTVVSADDFLPLFTYVLVQADMPQLVLVKELMTWLVDDEETYGELGYYMATLEAAVQHVSNLARQYKREGLRPGSILRTTTLRDSHLVGFRGNSSSDSEDDYDGRF